MKSWILLWVGLGLAGSVEGAESMRRAQWVMGAVLEINLPAGTPLEATNQAFAEVQRDDRLWSRFYPLSEVNQIRHAKSLQLTEPTAKLVALALGLAEQTQGAFNPALGPLLRLWGEAKQHLPPLSKIRQATWQSDYHYLRLEGRKLYLDRPGMGLALGAVGKGYALDRAGERLKESGLVPASLHFGGSSHLYVNQEGAPVCRHIQLESPRARGQIALELSFHFPALSSSSNLGQSKKIQGKTFGHLLDPKTGSLLPHEKQAWSVTVLADRGALADGWATALAVLGPKKGKKILQDQKNLEAIWVRQLLPGQFVIEHSAGLSRLGRRLSTHFCSQEKA